MMRRKPWVFLLVILLSQLALSVLLGATVTYGAGYSKAPEGLIVWEKDLSGMTKEEAYEVLMGVIPKAVGYNQEVYPLELEQTYQDLKDYLAGQYIISTGNIMTDAFEYLRRMSITLPSPERLNQEEIFAQLRNIALDIDQPGKPASVYYENGKVVLEEGSLGVRLNIDKSWEQLKQSNGTEAVLLITEVIEVHPTTAELEKIKDPLGDYTTYFDSFFYERVTNVRLAAKAINGLILPPGGEFSFNDVVGKREPERGYLPALIYMGNKVVTDDGGGICQDSTTLYQAIKQAKLEVVERHSHSMPVSYVPLGQDATVAYGVLDFRFRNTTQGYLLINAVTGGNWIRVRIFGMADSEHPVLNEPDGYPVKPGEWLNDK
ncbi:MULTISPECIES: VanW family protein [Desulfitobacterium]|uniref:Putative vancomycin resistance protein n=1 Tax=Desulfitobacterium dehalogenans (strain ATCC 51507 / DSM 9161 / JW/IU-DC1) TaxID=756499 RepID=I4AA74_DESDJ|nr:MULTISPECIES: VanW family protein [Desulfitobacterium]AFM00859.1 putative vancomycin resistance protein [Desulfitobacterium dehalogenans ATCC 51507]